MLEPSMIDLQEFNECYLTFKSHFHGIKFLPWYCVFNAVTSYQSYTMLSNIEYIIECM